MQRVIESVTARPQPIRMTPGYGTIPWLLQRVTAYGLIVFLAVHMWFNHYADLRTGNPITFELVNRRFELFPVLYALNDIGLLACAVFHGMNGVRNVIYDITTNPTGRRIATIVLVVISLVALVDGSLTLLALMQLPTTAAR
jgi:succinate dehydrogenase / fumarate reductase, membrane anchor subunit